MSDVRVRAKLGPVLWAFAAVTLLATCAEPIYQDYTQRFPLGTQPETVTMATRFNGTQDPYAGPNEGSVDALVAGYLARGHGPVTIAARAPTARNSPTPARVEQLRQRLIAGGVPASAIRVQLVSEGEPDTLSVSYERYVALLPSCGDWSQRFDQNYLNTDYPGFGCSQQHNLGAMAADPADLVSARAQQPSDTANTERVIRSYRGAPSTNTGTPVSTPSPAITGESTIQGQADSNAASGAGAGGGGLGSSTR